MIAIVGILLSLCGILILRELDIYPLREATKIIRRPWFETFLLLFCVGGLIQYGATKGTNGTENANQPSRLTQRSGLQSGDSRGSGDGRGDPLAITNLCFTGIVPLSNSVCLSVAWPTNMFAEGTTLDFFAKVNALTNGWTWLEAYATVPFATNLEVEIAYPILVSSPSVPAAMFFRVQDRNTCALTMCDSDLDGIPDVYELHNGTNPYVPDSGSVPRLTVGQNGTYASVEAALADSMAYSVIALGGETFVQSKSLVMPSHPVLIEGPDGGYAVIQSDSEIGAIMLTDGQDAQTMFRNLIVDLRAQGNFQAGFWVGGNTPWTGRGAAATFENVRIRANYPGVEHFGWLFYGNDGGSSVLRQCVMNAAGSTWAYGVSSFNAASNVIEDCAFLNMPTNAGETAAIAVLARESTNVVTRAETAENPPDLSWAGYPYGGSYSQTADADGDGLSDYDEIFLTNTDPWLADSDGDRILDGEEVEDETDPQNLNSHGYRLVLSVRNADIIPNVTNYVFVASDADQWSNLVYFCSGEGGTTNFLWKIEGGALIVSSFRDLNRNGIVDCDDDIVLSNRVSGLQTVADVTFSFGDVDGDGILDIQELADGSDPYDSSQLCFNLTLVEQGIFHTTNFLSGEICVGSRTICGPLPLSGRQWEADVGHVVVSNRDQLVAYFWDDVNANGVRDAGEMCVTQQVKIVGHENCLTNTLEMGGFDMDKDGMLDYWEDLHKDAGLSSTNAADAFWDADADGLINLHEYWAGCDPIVPDGSNTVLSMMARAVDDRIRRQDILVGKEKFVNYIVNGWAGVFSVDTNCWLYGVDSSCASPWQSNGARNCWAATLITPRHMIGAQHHTSGVGHRYWFVGKSGAVYIRQTIAARDVVAAQDTDLRILLLDEELPTNDVSIATFLPDNYDMYIGKGTGLPMICFDKEEKVLIQDVVTLHSDMNRPMVSGTASPNGKRAEYWEVAESGDSGNPRFLLLGTQLLMVNITWFASGFSGTSISAYMKEIQTAVDELTPGLSYVLKRADFNCYDTIRERP